MLSLNKCRRLLNRGDLLNHQVESTRDSLYFLAEALVSEFLSRKASSKRTFASIDDETDLSKDASAD